jgi:hypothetical protein
MLFLSVMHLLSDSPIKTYTGHIWIFTIVWIMNFQINEATFFIYILFNVNQDVYIEQD